MAFDHNALGRVGGFAVVDIVGTVLIAYALSRHFRAPVAPTIVAAFVTGEIVHWAIGVNTPLLRQATSIFFRARQ